MKPEAKQDLIRAWDYVQTLKHSEDEDLSWENYKIVERLETTLRRIAANEEVEL